MSDIEINYGGINFYYITVITLKKIEKFFFYELCYIIKILISNKKIKPFSFFIFI